MFNSIRLTGAVWFSALAFSMPDRGAEVRLQIQEANHSSELPARVHLRDETGKPVRAPGLPFFRDHFSCAGAVTLDLAPGEYAYEIERGPEYSSAHGAFKVGAERTNITIRLQRLADLAAEGWWSGELHVHRPLEEIELLMRAEDLHIAPVITWWNNHNRWRTNSIPENRLVRFDSNRFYHVMGGEDEREGGALLYFQLAEPLSITGAGREHPSPMQFLEQALKHPDVHIDIEKPFWWDAPIWIASGHVDTIGIANNHMWRGGVLDNEAWGKPRDKQRFAGPRGNGLWTQEIYYHLLNCGLRIPPSAGSASGVLPNPVGYNRVYVQVDGDLTWEKWWSGLRAGRSFVSNGPLLRCKANGQLPGHVFRSTDKQPLTITPQVSLTTRDPKGVVEIVQNGKVLRSIPYSGTNVALGPVVFREAGWFLVRAVADVPHTFRFASTAPFYVEFAGQSNRMSKKSTEFFLDWVQERKERVRVDDPDQRRSVLQHHTMAEEFWRTAISKANAP